MCEPVSLTAAATSAAAAGGTAAALGTGLGAASAASVASAGFASGIGASLGTGSLLASTGAATTGGLFSSISASQILGLGGAILSGASSMQQAETQKRVAENNAKIAGWQADDARERGEKEAMETRRRAAQFKSTQRVSLASKGLDLAYGTAADLQDQTDFFGEADTTTARNNARKEEWSRRAQAGNFTAEAASISPWMRGAGSFLTSGGAVAGKWYDNGRTRDGFFA